MRHDRGFTIVELLIVIVVIAILAAITIVAFNGVQDRSRDSKIEHDLTLLQKAMMAARVNTGEQALRYVTVQTGTSANCVNKTNGTDLAALDKATDSCWTMYASALNYISNASNINVRGLVDPWGRPY